MEVRVGSSCCASGRPYSAGCVLVGQIWLRWDWSGRVLSWLILGPLNLSIGRQTALGVPPGCSILKSKPRAGHWGSKDHLPLTSAGWDGPIDLLSGHLLLCLWYMYVCVCMHMYAWRPKINKEHLPLMPFHPIFWDKVCHCSTNLMALVLPAFLHRCSALYQPFWCRLRIYAQTLMFEQQALFPVSYLPCSILSVNIKHFKRKSLVQCWEELHVRYLPLGSI